MQTPNSLEPSRVVVLSDLHLWGPTDPLYRALLKFLDEEIHENDHLFIVGDLFDLFVGHKAVFEKRFCELIDKIKGFHSKNVSVYYIEGNHDFHLEGIFDDAHHVRIFSDSFHYEAFGKRFFFCHGDSINYRDVGYQLFRMTTRNLFFQSLIDAVPGEFIDKVGTLMSGSSRKLNLQRSSYAEYDEGTVKIFRNYACEKIASGYDFVIMGHSHFFDEIKFRVNSHEGQYINAGYPRKHKKFFVLSKNDPCFLAKDWHSLVSTTQ